MAVRLRAEVDVHPPGVDPPDPRPPDGRPPATGAVVLAIGPDVGRADIPALCQRLTALVRHDRAAVVVCDVGAIIHPDAVVLDALARLRLTARRLGCALQIYRAHHRLRDLIAFAGLGEVLPVEPGRQVEQREEALGVQERVDPTDPAG